MNSDSCRKYPLICLREKIVTRHCTSRVCPEALSRWTRLHQIWLDIWSRQHDHHMWKILWRSLHGFQLLLKWLVYRCWHKACATALPVMMTIIRRIIHCTISFSYAVMVLHWWKSDNGFLHE